MLNLNLPRFEYLIKTKDGKHFIYDVIRKKYIVLNPEEWVRQHFIHFLINTYSISKNHISLESGLKYNEMGKRTDILVMSDKLEPLILVECKAPHIDINEKVIFQLGTYNSILKSQYLIATNGMMTLYWKNENEGYISIDKLPNAKVLRKK